VSRARCGRERVRLIAAEDRSESEVGDV